MGFNEKELLEILDNYMDKKPSMVVENTVENFGSYKIEVYLASEPEDKVFISGNRKFIQEFLDKGYMRAGIGNFFGCANPNAVKKNTTMLKVARESDSNKIVAMSIYSSRWGGFKCVGATVTTEQSLRSLGIIALDQIIREDTKLWDKFVWAECSGAIEYKWDKFGGIKIPNAYLPMFMDERTLNEVEIDDDEIYVYRRVINRGTENEVKVSKVIYGFPNEDVMNRYINDTNTSFESLCEKYGKDMSDVLIEHLNYRQFPERLWPDLKILRHFHDLFTSLGRNTLTELEMKVLVSSANNVNAYFKERANEVWNNNEKEAYSLLLFSMTIANCCTILKPYELGDILEPENEQFSVEDMYPDCLY